MCAQGLDIGPDSLKTFQDALSDSKTVIWNGPMGVFEFEKFARGTYGVAETLAELTPKVRPRHSNCNLLILLNRSLSSADEAGQAKRVVDKSALGYFSFFCCLVQDSCEHCYSARPT